MAFVQLCWSVSSPRLSLMTLEFSRKTKAASLRVRFPEILPAGFRGTGLYSRQALNSPVNSNVPPCSLVVLINSAVQQQSSFFPNDVRLPLMKLNTLHTWRGVSFSVCKIMWPLERLLEIPVSLLSAQVHSDEYVQGKVFRRRCTQSRRLCAAGSVLNSKVKTYLKSLKMQINNNN